MKFTKLFAFASLVSVLVLTGCKEDKVDKFTGSWECLQCVGRSGMTYTAQQTMNIKKDGDIFHIDIQKFQNSRNDSKDINDAKEKITKLEAKAESDSVLSLINAPAMSQLSTLRLENNVITFGNDVYTPVKK